MNTKLSGWKAKCLSQVGRLTFSKSILQADPIYKLSILECPVGYARKLDKACMNFFWGLTNSGARKMHFLKANDLHLPISQGGLPLKDTKMMNKALLAKNIWRFSQNQDCLVGKWAFSKYGTSIGDVSFKSSPQSSFVWKGIYRNNDIIMNLLRWRIGNGISIDISSTRWDFP